MKKHTTLVTSPEHTENRTENEARDNKADTHNRREQDTNIYPRTQGKKATSCSPLNAISK
jgi:hypothetical protein